ncbi:MAG: hypothetical protein AAF733_09720, partial [Verrucomicrobiota bacterium]
MRFPVSLSQNLFLSFSLIFAVFATGVSQDSAPESSEANAVAAPTTETVEEAVANVTSVRDLFLSLAKTAADGDEKVAEDLAALILRAGGVSLPRALQTEGVPQSASRARELLA